MEILIKHKKLFAAIFWIWGFTIVFFSIIPNGPKLQIDINNKILRLDYLLHFLVYFTLSVLFLFWKADKYLSIKTKLILYFLAGALLFSIATELVQTYIPGRTFNPIDFFSNAAGIIAGIFVPRLFFK